MLLSCLARSVLTFSFAVAASAVSALPASAATFRPQDDSAGSLIAVSGDTWARHDSSGVQLSRDAGRTWMPVGPQFYGGESAITTEPDGAFYTATQRITPTGEAAQRIVRVPGIPYPKRGCVSPIGFDASGGRWIAACAEDGTLIVGRELITDENGVMVLTMQPVANAGSSDMCGSNHPLETRTDPAGVWFGCVPENRTGGPHSALVSPGGTVSAAHGALQPDGIGLFTVTGNPDVLWRPSEQLLVRSANALLRAGVEIPSGTLQVTQTSGGLLVRGGWALSWGVIDGAISPLAPIGPFDPHAQAMVDRINTYRAHAGLLPMLYHGGIVQAASNHGRYLAANGKGKGGSAHDETPGKPHFTGESPSARCAAVGVDCGGEVISHAQGVAGVDQLMNTVFHRWMLLGGYLYAGPNPDGATVINFAGRNGWYTDRPLSPSVWPVGAYDGPLTFGGGEWPDPAHYCAPKAATWGTPITYTGEADPERAAITLTRVRDGKHLPGCTGYRAPPGEACGFSPTARSTPAPPTA